MSVAIELLGEALSENTKIKILKMSENKMRATSYIKFWQSIKGNNSLQWIDVMKTEITDKISESIGIYLKGKAY